MPQLGAAWSARECFIHFIKSWKRHQTSVESSLITSDKLLRLLDGDFLRGIKIVHIRFLLFL